MAKHFEQQYLHDTFDGMDPNTQLNVRSAPQPGAAKERAGSSQPAPASRGPKPTPWARGLGLAQFSLARIKETRTKPN